MSKVSSLPLREKFTAAERLTRELIEHLDQGFLPRIKALRRVCRKDESSGVTDKSVRHECQQLFKSEDFSDQLISELSELFDSIDTELQTMV
ncbi:MAG: hypothetical protein AB8G99_18450 [Planctomycetaceae bacterium]